ncbi:site-specific recombinase XerD [Pedobacter sp. AK013]|uniref:site-specific integrase n=1 Tax=Pedobacter sp. AK013 TaxID=2723071 RepID=UPI0016109941|nr:site-specific integrase [Pedobacter sp. AK013]MBB6237797.1 site-specific recombinase XerD [Pedobacter sp. AK013]
MSTNYSLLFYLKKPKGYLTGPKPIYMRITVNGIPKEVSTNRNCDPSRWNSKANRASGTKEEFKTLNSYLDALQHKVMNIHLELMKTGADISSEVIKQKFLGKDIERRMLIEQFSDHNQKMEALLGNGFKQNTLKGYKTTSTHISQYLEKEYKTSDIDIRLVDHAFVVGLEFYLRSVAACSAVTTAKYIKNFRKIINLCLAHRWLTENPFLLYKTKVKAKEKEFLTKSELERIERKDFKIERLQHVRDIFVFCCYTGLSYIDVKQLRTSDIATGVDGKLWVLTSREKTDINSNIPLLPDALNIINKYSDYPPSAAKGLALPVLSNQKMNSYLKEIADLCEITKELTFHKARHTFATTITLSNNVPIETVSKMLGHSNIKTTQHYAKLLDTRVGTDMDTLKQKLQRPQI